MQSHIAALEAGLCANAQVEDTAEMTSVFPPPPKINS